MLWQQLNLVADNIRSTFLGALLLIVVVRVALLDDSNALALNTWCALKLLVQVNSKLIVRHFDRLTARAPVAEAALHRVVGLMVLNSTMGGFLWGGLIWVAPDPGTLLHISLVVAVVAIVTSGAVSTVSALMPVFLGLLVPTLLMLIAKLGVMVASVDSRVDASLALVGALYVLTLLDQARKGAVATKASIQLRFENAALLDEVRLESDARQQARRDAELASAAKSKVLAAASHDLRQPVHAQGLFLDLLANTDPTERQQALLSLANAAVQAQSAMLGTLFDFARIEAGSIQPRMQAFALQPLLNKVEREFAPQADAKGLGFRSRESSLVVRSDPALVELILRNLVSNAIRYTDRGGLLMACRRRGVCAVLEVWDTGIGISPQHQREVFREFHQLDDLERDRRKGFGLGLAIVDSLARTLAHELALASRPQRGSVFRLMLPTSAEASPHEAAALDLRRPLVPGTRVLLIEDDASIQLAMRELLDSWGCVCEVGSSIDQAVSIAQRMRPDLVISDYWLNGKRSGIEVVAELRALLGKSLAALLVTGDTHPNRLKDACGHGIALLQKPVLPSRLHSAMVAVLQPSALPARAK